MFELKNPAGNVHRIVSTEVERDRLLDAGWKQVEELATETEEPATETEEPATETEEPAASVVTEEVPEAQPPKKSKKTTAKKADKE